MNNPERKITKIGNSLGITIPNEMLALAGLKQGDDIQLEIIEGVIQIKKSRKVSLPDGISEDFFETLSDTVATYDETIKGLVNR